MRRRPNGTTNRTLNRTQSPIGRLPRAVMLAAVLWVSCARPAPAPRTAALVAKAAPPPVLAPPPLALVPADVARLGLVATFVVPSLDRSLASAVVLIKQAAPLPLDAAGVRDMLLGQAGLPPEVAKHLDLGAPIAGAVVLGSKGQSPLTAFSFAGRSPQDAAALPGALGRMVARRGAAVEVENAAGDRGWFLPMGSVLVFADTEEALERAGSLALETRRAPRGDAASDGRAGDDASVMLSPEMLARAAGTDLATALARLRDELEQRAAAGGSKLGPEAMRQLSALAQYLGDIATAELAIHLDPARGASVLARLAPRPGSRLEAVARATQTIALEPALLRSSPGVPVNDTGIVLTSAYGRSTLEQLARVRGKLPANGTRPGSVASRLLEVLADGLTGQLALMGRVYPSFSWEALLPARDPASATRIQTALLAGDKQALDAIVQAALAGEGLAMTPRVLKVRRESAARTRVVHVTLAPVVPRTADPAVRKMFGAGPLDLFIAVVRGDRLAITAGEGAKARMTAIAAETPPQKSAAGASPEGGAAVADFIVSGGRRSFFFFVDARQLLALVATTWSDPRARMLNGATRAPLPLLGGATGDGKGRVFTLDLTIPPACFSGMGALIQAAMFTRN